jgi:HK97 family phage major capsid protein
MTFALQNEPVRKIAHWIPASEELLEDAPATSSYIDSRLRYGVLRREDQQLLSGTGVAPEIQGILSRTGLAADVVRTDPQTNADAILEQIVTIESTTGLAVTGVVMNPLAWAAIIGSKLTTGEYLAGGPFGSPTAPMIWNRQVALTDQITSTVALVGAFRTGGQVFRHGGVRVATTNAHADYFIKNMVAIRAEERLALAVYRQSAFGKVTSLTVTPTAP